MNSYELSRSWFNFSFDNPEKIRPIHSAVFFFAIEHCNRLGWKSKFGFPTQMAMDAIGIKKPHTFLKARLDLVEWGFFEMIEESKNQYSSCIISLKSAMPKKDTALDIALSRHGTEHGQSTGQSTVIINKQTNKQTSNKGKGENVLFEKFYKSYPKKKSPSEAKKAWKKQKIDKNALEEILKSLEWQKKSEDWTREGGQFIPYPATYLNQRRWEDEPTKTKPNGLY